ncbi:uncharacterized protein [Nothobranchius furzeri]|uniref:uncharacterized protein n=1 Tax=Nothobranchius furzeri TaxID=105023 RepID=UPI003904CE9B
MKAEETFQQFDEPIMQPYEQTQRTYRGPVKAFHRTTQKTSRSATHRPFGALHVCIAWRIYYHKLKNMHHKPNSQLLPEFPPTCDPEEWLHPTCRLPSSGSSDRNETETAPNLKHSRSYLPDLHPSSRDPNLNPELDRRSRKRPLDCDRFRDMKRAKNQFDSAPTAPQPSSYRFSSRCEAGDAPRAVIFTGDDIIIIIIIIILAFWQQEST